MERVLLNNGLGRFLSLAVAIPIGLLVDYFLLCLNGCQKDVWIFIYIGLFSYSTLVVVFLFLWPHKLYVSKKGILLLYKRKKDDFIRWEDIIDIKSYTIVYRRKNGKEYFGPTRENIQVIKEAWEEWKREMEST